MSEQTKEPRDKPFGCPNCQRRFVHQDALTSHGHAKHRNSPHFGGGRSESFAEMAIEAEMRRAGGLNVPEDIAWLLP